MKKNFLKNLIVVMLVLFLAVTLVVGCKEEAVTEEVATEEAATEEAATEEAATEEAATEEAAAEKPLEISLALGSKRTEWTEDTWVIQKISEVTGIKIKPLPIVLSDIPQKRAVMIASQTLPDVMCQSDGDGYRTIMSAGPKGAYYPLDTILDKMPNFARWIEEYPEILNIMTASDGHIYALPKINTFMNFQYGLIIRANLLEGEETTADSIDTIDDLYNALMILKDKTGTPPWIARPNVTEEQSFLDMMAQVFGTGLNMYYNTVEDKYSFGPLEDNYYKMVEFLNKCYSSDLINKDIFVMTDENWEALGLSGDGNFCTDKLIVGTMFDTIETDDINWEVILPPKVDGKRNFGTINIGNIDTGVLWTVSASTENIDAAAKFLDYGYSDEGYDMWTWGEEGTTFERDSNGDPMFIVDEDKGWPNFKVDGVEISLYALGIYQSDRNVFMWDEYSENKKWVTSFAPTYDADSYPAAKKLYLDNEVVPSVKLPVIFSPEWDEVRISIEQVINTLTDENIANFITGVRPMEEWDDFIGELEAADVGLLIEVYGNAFDEMYK